MHLHCLVNASSLPNAPRKTRAVSGKDCSSRTFAIFAALKEGRKTRTEREQKWFNIEIEMLSMDLWLGLTMILPQISWTEPQKILREVIALRFGTSPKPPCFNIPAPSARLQTNEILILQPLQLRRIQKNQTTAGVLLCREALTRSRKLAELALGRGTFLHRPLVACPQLHIAVKVEQRYLPPFSRMKSLFPPWKRKTSKEKKKNSLKSDYITF